MWFTINISLISMILERLVFSSKTSAVYEYISAAYARKRCCQFLTITLVVFIKVEDQISTFNIDASLTALKLADYEETIFLMVCTMSESSNYLAKLRIASLALPLLIL